MQILVEYVILILQIGWKDFKLFHLLLSVTRAGRRTHERLLLALSGDPPAQIHLQGEQLPWEARALLKAYVGLRLQRAKSEAAQ